MDQETIEYYHEHYHNFIAGTLHNTNIIKFIKKFVGALSKNAYVLDLGCGSGRDLKLLKDHCQNIVGMDYSFPLLQFAKKHSLVNSVQGSILNIPFSDSTFDAIWNCAVLLHLSKSEAFTALKEMYRISKNGAFLYISVKEGKSTARDKRGRFFQYYSKEEFTNILKKANFHLIDIRKTTGETNWLNAFVVVKKDLKTPVHLTIEKAIYFGRVLLENKENKDSMEAKWIMDHIIQKNYNPRTLLSQEQFNTYFSLIEKRLNHHPLSYLLGTKGFMEFDFFVNNHVLIPRPETQLIVEKALLHIKNKNYSEVLDIGTGSGCIPISIAKYSPTTYLMAVDISEKALEVAKKNCRYIGVTEQIQWIQSDLFSAIPTEKQFDVICSNPPYISEKDYRALMPDVKNYEPKLALIAEENGLIFYRRIMQSAHTFMKKDAILIMELGYDQFDAVKNLIPETLQFEKVIKDFSGIKRVIQLRKVSL